MYEIQAFEEHYSEHGCHELTICVSPSVKTPMARFLVVWTFFDTANTFGK